MSKVHIIGQAQPLQQLEAHHADGGWALITPGEWGDEYVSIRVYDFAECMNVEEATALRDTLTVSIRRASVIEKQVKR